MRRITILITLAIISIISFNGCIDQTIRVSDISGDIMNYEQQKAPSIVQQSGSMLFGKEVTNITFDSLVIFGCNSLSDELSDDISYNGYFVTTWDIEKTSRNKRSSEQKTVYVNFYELTLKKDGKQFSYEWRTDYNTAFNSIRWDD
jgi:hypothetical protein